MKKLTTLAILATIIAMISSSCSNEVGADAKMSYAMGLDSVIFADTLDNGLYRKVDTILNHDVYCKTPTESHLIDTACFTAWTEEAHVDVTSSSYATAVCNDQAANKALNKLNNLTSEKFSELWYHRYPTDSIHSSTIIIYMSLWNANSVIYPVATGYSKILSFN